jgi:hypothetical protein
VPDRPAAEEPPVNAGRPALQAGPLARWLTPTAESRLERIGCGDIDQRPWDEPDGTDDSLVALRRSVHLRGIVEPLLLRPLDHGRFEVVLGARRLQVARQLGLATVPAIVRELGDAEASLIAVWSSLPRMLPGQLGQVAGRLTEAGVGDAEVALLLATPTAGTAPDQEPHLFADSAPLRFAGGATPVHRLLDALGAARADALPALRALDPERLAPPGD